MNRQEICSDRTRSVERLLGFLRIDRSAAEVSGMEEMSGTDWKDLLHASNRHGVTPLLYHRLATSSNSTLIPSKVLQELRRSYLQNSGINMNLYSKLGKLLKKLQQDDIPVILLKGAHLAEVVYGNIALRPMNDVDILVHKKDLMKVEAALLEIGYVPTEYHRLISIDNCHFAYGLPDRELFVEVHWDLFLSKYRFRIDISEQWERSVNINIAGVEVSVLCPEDLLIYLCLHTSKHLFEMGIKPVCDIIETIRYYGKEIDWNQIRIRCEGGGISKPVYLTLKIAMDLLGTKVPEELLKAIKPDDLDESFIAMAKERIFTPGQLKVGGFLLSPNIAQLFGPMSIFKKVVLFLTRVFPSREEMSRSYPASANSPRIYFYYTARIWELILRYGRQTWLLVRQDREMYSLVEQEASFAPLQEWLMSTNDTTRKQNIQGLFKKDQERDSL